MSAADGQQRVTKSTLLTQSPQASASATPVSTTATRDNRLIRTTLLKAGPSRPVPASNLAFAKTMRPCLAPG
jgi:hypothetical protein